LTAGADRRWNMSKSPLVMVAAVLGAGLISSAAVAQTAGLFAGAECREAKVDRVIEGKVLSSDLVIVCKRTDHLKTALQNDGIVVAAPPVQAQAKPAPTVDKRRTEHLAFTPPVHEDRECAMLNCPTYILTGVGD
jgi:hypothetical protein